jgi:hypothetical protein
VFILSLELGAVKGGFASPVLRALLLQSKYREPHCAAPGEFKETTQLTPKADVAEKSLESFRRMTRL